MNDETIDAPTPFYKENQLIKESQLKFEENTYLFKLSLTNNLLSFKAESLDLIPPLSYQKGYSLKDLISINKYFKAFDSINEIGDELALRIPEAKIIKKESEKLYIEIPIQFTKSPKCEFILEKEKQTNENLIENSFTLISELKEENKTLKNSIEQLEKKINENNIEKIKSEIFNFIYPIGSYYYTSNPENPEKLFGGKWEKITDRFIIGAGNKYKLNSIGGEESHTLSIDEIPPHNHIIEPLGGRFAWGGDFTNEGPASGNGWRSELSRHYTSMTGKGNPHNNIPPYLAAFCWHRIE